MSSPDTAVRVYRATMADLTPLAALFDAYRCFYQQQSDLAASRQFLEHRLQQGESVIFAAAAADGTPAGFTQLYPLFSSTRLRRLWLLNDLFVAPAFRGRHVSVQLIGQAQDFTRQTQAAGLILETAKSNVIANSLYNRAHFVLDTEHHYYAWNP